MGSAAVYPVPESASETAALVFLLIGVAVPVFLLVFTAPSRRGIWGLSEMAAIAVLFLLTLPLAAVMAGLALPLTLLDLSVVTIVQNVLFAALPAYVALVRYRLPLASLGVRADGWPRMLTIGTAAAAITTPLAIAGERVAIFLIGLVEGPAQAAARAAAEHLDDPLQPVMDTLSGVVPTAWFLILLAVVVPIGEEIFFRGFIYGGLRRRWGIIVATLGSAAFFSAAHLQVVHGLPILILGLVLALVYERSRSLVPTVVAHALNNIIAIVSMWQGWGL